jgi:glycosyltransferase involved in cell wall biosynthesis
MNKRICLLVSSLSKGGAEKVAASTSVLLSGKGYDVTVFSMRNEIDYCYAGHLYNFGLDKEKCGKIRAFFKLNNFFKKNKFDFIIDHRLRDKYLKEIIFSKFIFKNQQVIYCVHNYHLNYYFSFLNIPWLSILPHVKKRKFVSVSNEIRDFLMQKLHIESQTIYNFLNKQTLSISLINNEINNKDYIIGVGRLTSIKQFDKLISAYYKSELIKNEIKLVILGDGPEKENLELLISELNLEKYVELVPFKPNPYPLIANAKALVLTSKVEGFPMVLLEALSLKTPVIAFDCKSGPNEIVKDHVNGLLVEDQNEEQLIIALNKLLNDTFYMDIKNNTQIGLDVFSEDKIIQEWETLFENKR